MPSAPTNVSLTVTLSKVAVSWDAVTGATGYKVKRRRNSSSTSYLVIKNTASLTYTDFVPNFDADGVASTISGEVWSYIVSAYDSSSEVEAAAQTATMPAMAVSDIDSKAVSDPPYKSGGSTLTAAFSITNSASLTPTIDDNDRLIHESQLRGCDTFKIGST